MFCAVEQSEQRRIISLDPEWRQPDRLDALRSWCRADRMVCPECLAPVLFRTSEVISPHFAHKSLKDCPYAHEDAEKLLGRQVLYEWLITKTKPSNVDLEVRIDGAESPLDVLMQHEKGRYGYWFFHRNLRGMDRQFALKDDLRRFCASEIRTSTIYSSELYQPVTKTEDRVRLPTLLRGLMTVSEYGLPFGSGNSLHFLRTKERELLTLRGVDHYEGPQTYHFGRAVTSDILRVQVAPRTGEPVHAGEYEQVHRWKKEQAEQHRRETMSWQLAGARLQHSRYTPAPAAEPSVREVWVEQTRTAPCEKCGELTPERDWIIYSGATKTCTCRACMDGLRQGTTRAAGQELIDGGEY